jgi:hypothetical protein
MTKLNLNLIDNSINKYYYDEIIRETQDFNIEEWTLDLSVTNNFIEQLLDMRNVFGINLFPGINIASPVCHESIAMVHKNDLSGNSKMISLFKPYSGWKLFKMYPEDDDVFATRFLYIREKIIFEDYSSEIKESLYEVGETYETWKEDTDDILLTDINNSQFNLTISKFINDSDAGRYGAANYNIDLGYMHQSSLIYTTYSRNIVYVLETKSDRHGLIIPVYPDTYKYEDILRMILYVNELRFYCDNNGDLYIKELYPDEDQDDVFSVTERDILVDGYSESSVQKDYPNLSEALNPVWYDYINEGFFYKKLDITMRKIYENILIKRYPSELTCKILKRSMSTGEERNLDLHSILSCFNKFYIIVEIKENDTGFYYEVKAYELGNYNNNNIGGLFTSIGNNKLEDLNSNRFSTNKIWTDENLWIDSFGKYNEER